jgi:hypothetical protein
MPREAPMAIDLPVVLASGARQNCVVDANTFSLSTLPPVKAAMQNVRHAGAWLSGMFRAQSERPSLRVGRSRSW